MKKIISFTLIMSMLFCGFFTQNIFAKGSIDTMDENPTNEKYYDENGNYYNPETGEYFRWTSNPNSRGTIGTFEFNIQTTVTSSVRFAPTNTDIMIEVFDVHFETFQGQRTSCCDDHKFTVDFKKNGISTNLAYFTAPTSYAAHGLGGGFSTTSKYAIKVTNGDKLSGNKYLVGTGSVYSY